MKLNEGAAAAALSVGVMEMLRVYRDTAPTLSEIRRAQPGDYVHRQLLLDADMLGLIVVVMVGGGAAYLMKKIYPLVFALLTLALISMYYRMVLNSSNEGMLEE